MQRNRTQPSITVIDRAHLIVVTGRDVGRRQEVGETLVVGRGEVADFQVDDDIVSRVHARITKKVEGYFIEDLGSRNGIAINGSVVKESKLAFGDRIAMGGTVMLFVQHDEAQEQLEQQQRLQSLGELAGGVAHDFNNLIGAILASVTHMQELGIHHEELERGLANVEIAARRAADFTARLLTFGSARQKAYHAVSVRGVVEETRKLVSGTLSRSIELRTQCDENLAVVGDESRLIQALMNLCINANDAMRDGGTLWISARRVPRCPDEGQGSPIQTSGGYAEITVADTGAGISPDTLSNIFRPFFTTKKRGEGTGLGLATVQAIVKGHGGYIEAHSEPGEGTTFTLYLPAAPPGVHASENTAEVRAPADRTLRGVVLLADDEVVVLNGLKSVLERSGMRVLCASDGEAAIALYEKHEPEISVVILDLDMPVMTGTEVLARIRAVDYVTPVIISTGHVTTDREEALVRAGATSFLHKPYDAAGLREAVRNALAGNVTRPPGPK